MIKYRVRLLESQGYSSLGPSIGKEFDAVLANNLYEIRSDAFEEHILPTNKYLCFDTDAVEVLEVSTGHRETM